MNKPSLLSFLALGLAIGLAQTVAQTPAASSTEAIQKIQPPPPAPAKKVDASAAIEKTDATGGFRKKHEAFLARGKAGPIGVLMLGDSITEGWTKAPHVYERYYGKMDPANFGIGGDQTQHVIWRIENGELDGIHPKVVVLMIGTNNSSGHTAEEITAADKKIVEMIRAKIPETKVLLLAIFPRGARKDAKGVVTEASIADATKRMAVINSVNAELAKLDDGANVRFLDINAVFLGQDGKIPWQLMPDQLHPTAAGYQLWAEAMQKPLAEMMK
jgi:lysophospholipase L1-like esterase